MIIFFWRQTRLRTEYFNRGQIVNPKKYIETLRHLKRGNGNFRSRRFGATLIKKKFKGEMVKYKIRISRSNHNFKESCQACELLVKLLDKCTKF